MRLDMGKHPAPHGRREPAQRPLQRLHLARRGGLQHQPVHQLLANGIGRQLLLRVLPVQLHQRTGTGVEGLIVPVDLRTQGA